jgi:UDP-N-acetylglucosamine 2-epimerase
MAWDNQWKTCQGFIVKKMQLIHIVGCRPNFIKLAPVYEAAKKRGASQIVIHTGQHYDYEMSEMFFDELGLPRPEINLGVTLTGLMLMKLEDCLKQMKGTVIVYGDTNSTLAGALAAKKLKFKVAHVEAGIRSWDNTMPEEINRKVVDEISDVLFCPSEVAKSNLNGKAMNVGDVTYDAFLKAQRDLVKCSQSHYLVTIHRENNTEEDRFRKIESTIKRIAKTGHVAFFMHPRLKSLTDFGTPPEGYVTTLSFIRGARAVITDSGGIQKEAFWSKVPCITVRNSTEWPETVRSGWNTLVEPDGILEAVEKASKGEDIPNPYGDGKAAEKIIECLSWLQ